MNKKRNKSPFTDEELEEIKAMLYDAAALSMNGAMYRGRKEYAMAYNNVQARKMALAKEEEERQAEAEAIRLLEARGYKINR